MEREHGVGENGDLETLLGLQAGASGGSVTELTGQDGVACELGL
jgi:hypothetical protein